MSCIKPWIFRAQLAVLGFVFRIDDAVAQTSDPAAPNTVRQWLQRNDCRVHQPAKDPLETQPPPASLTRGRFRGTSQHDWAALCSRRDASLLLVFRGGRAEHIDTLEISAVPPPAGRGIYAAPPSEVRMY